jgi:hypothetical protein
MSAERLFSGNKTYSSLVTKGSVLGLEFAGTNCVQVCQQSLNNLIQSKYPNIPREVYIENKNLKLYFY